MPVKPKPRKWLYIVGFVSVSLPLRIACWQKQQVHLCSNFEKYVKKNSIFNKLLYLQVSNCKRKRCRGSVKHRFSNFFLPISINKKPPPPFYEFFIKIQPSYFITNSQSPSPQPLTLEEINNKFLCTEHNILKMKQS